LIESIEDEWDYPNLCHACGNRYETMSALQRHIKLAHPPVKIQTRFHKKDKIYSKY